MISRRTFLISINGLVLVPHAFASTLNQPAALPATVQDPRNATTESPRLDVDDRATQFKIYGWNANESDKTDPNTTVIYLSNSWRSGWL